MADKLEWGEKFGVACLGITHPHASGRVRAMQRIENTVVLGAADDSPLRQPFVQAMGIEALTKADILGNPDVHAVLVDIKEWRSRMLSAKGQHR
jgi:hypothetical protein